MINDTTCFLDGFPYLEQLVEGVEVPLPLLLGHHPGLLQQVVVDVAPDRVTCTTTSVCTSTTTSVITSTTTTVIAQLFLFVDTVIAICQSHL